MAAIINFIILIIAINNAYSKNYNLVVNIDEQDLVKMIKKDKNEKIGNNKFIILAKEIDSNSNPRFNETIDNLLSHINYLMNYIADCNVDIKLIYFSYYSRMSVFELKEYIKIFNVKDDIILLYNFGNTYLKFSNFDDKYGFDYKINEFIINTYEIEEQNEINKNLNNFLKKKLTLSTKTYNNENNKLIESNVDKLEFKNDLENDSLNIIYLSFEELEKKVRSQNEVLKKTIKNLHIQDENSDNNIDSKKSLTFYILIVIVIVIFFAFIIVCKRLKFGHEKKKSLI